MAGPAQADDANAARGPVDRLLPVDEAGDRVGAAIREVGHTTGDRVREAAAPVRPLAPVGDRVADQVAHASDAVADGAESVSRGVDEVVDEPAAPLPEAPAAPPEEPDGDAGDASPADRGERSSRDRAAPGDVRARAEHRASDPGGVRATRTADVVAPAPAALTASPVAEADTSAEVPEPGPLQPVAGCDDCAAAGISSGDPLHVLGLPSQGVTAPRIADTVPRDAGEGGPGTIVRRPDVSPD